MALRAGGRAVPPEPDALAAAFPAAGPRLVVFLHGLMESEHAWRLGGREPYGARLERDLGRTAARRPLQQRPPHLAQRALARRAARADGRGLAGAGRGDRARRPFDGRPRRPQRLPPGRRGRDGLARPGPARREPRHAASRRAARAGRPPRRARPPRAARDAPVRALPAPPQRRHPRPAPRLARRPRLGGLRPRRAAGRRVRRGPAAAGCDALLRRGDDHARRASPRRPVPRRLARPLAERVRPRPDARARLPRGGRAHVGGAHHLALLNHPAVYTALRGWLATPPPAAG